MNSSAQPGDGPDQTMPLDTTSALHDPPRAHPAPEAPASFFRRHGVGVAIVAAVLAVIVVAGGTAWGVSAAVAAGQTAPVTSAMASQKHASTAHRARAHAVQGTRGTITSINGDTWVVHSASGADVTVTLTSTTAFGTAKAPASLTSFSVGDTIGALGAHTGNAVTAKRIVHLPLKAASTPAPSGASS